MTPQEILNLIASDHEPRRQDRRERPRLCKPRCLAGQEPGRDYASRPRRSVGSHAYIYNVAMLLRLIPRGPWAARAHAIACALIN